MGGDGRAVAPGIAYPYEELDRLWKTVLLHQFHDILPGQLDRLGAPRGRGDLRRSVARGAGSDHRRRPARRGRRRRRRPWVFNPARRPRAEVVTVPRRLAAGCRSDPGRRRRRHLARCRPRPVPLDGDGADNRAGTESRSRTTLDNGLLRVELDDDGPAHLGPRPGRRPRGARAGARGNLLQLHPDLPNDWDAWDIDGTTATGTST